MIAEFIVLNLQGSIDQKLDSIDRMNLMQINFSVEFPLSPSLYDV